MEAGEASGGDPQGSNPLRAGRPQPPLANRATLGPLECTPLPQPTPGLYSSHSCDLWVSIILFALVWVELFVCQLPIELRVLGC
jgi:hypothetical protein